MIAITTRVDEPMQSVTYQMTGSAEDSREEASYFLVIHDAIDGPLGNLESVDMDDREDGTGFGGVDVLDSVPSSSGGARFCLTVTDDAADDEVWVVHDCAEGDAQGVTKFTALVDCSRSFCVNMAVEI